MYTGAVLTSSSSSISINQLVVEQFTPLALWYSIIIYCAGDWERPFKLDAPVSGSVTAAEAGTLTFMVLLLFYSNMLRIYIKLQYNFGLIV